MKQVRCTRLASLPNTAWGLAVGLGGNAMLWKTCNDVRFTQQALGAPGMWLFFVAGVAFWLLLFVATVVKLWRYPGFVWREFFHAERCYFFFMPNISLCMLAIAVPPSLCEDWRGARTAAFCVGCFAQVVLSMVVYVAKTSARAEAKTRYRRWMFSCEEVKNSSMGSAAPPYLLSTLGWSLGAVLAQELDMDRRWRVDVSAMLLGCGVGSYQCGSPRRTSRKRATGYYVIAAVSIIQHLNEHPQLKGQPSLFLLLAAPATAATAFAGYEAGFQGVPVGILGFSWILFLVLLETGPKLAERPRIFGEYWAYVSSLASLASATIRNGEDEGSKSTKVIAWFVFAVAEVAFALVAIRSGYHTSLVVRRRALYLDPLAPTVTYVDVDGVPICAGPSSPPTPAHSDAGG